MIVVQIRSMPTLKSQSFPRPLDRFFTSTLTALADPELETTTKIPAIAEEEWNLEDLLIAVKAGCGIVMKMRNDQFNLISDDYSIGLKGWVPVLGWGSMIPAEDANNILINHLQAVLGTRKNLRAFKNLQQLRTIYTVKQFTDDLLAELNASTSSIPVRMPDRQTIEVLCSN